jgi:hypothetical protein
MCSDTRYFWKQENRRLIKETWSPRAQRVYILGQKTATRKCIPVCRYFEHRISQETSRFFVIEVFSHVFEITLSTRRDKATQRHVRFGSLV